MTTLIELGPRDFMTADLHIGGAPWPYKLWFGKGVEDPKKLVRSMVRTGWEYQVAADSTVVILGDALDLRAEDVEAELEFFSELPGRKILVPGNNDLVHPMFNLDTKKLSQQGWFDVFDVRDAQSTMVQIGPHGDAMACHYPNAERQQARWRHEKFEEPLAVLHGHTHARKAVSRTAAGVLQINVGWPAWRKLASTPEIVNELAVPWTI